MLTPRPFRTGQIVDAVFDGPIPQKKAKIVQI